MVTKKRMLTKEELKNPMELLGTAVAELFRNEELKTKSEKYYIEKLKFENEKLHYQIEQIEVDLRCALDDLKYIPNNERTAKIQSIEVDLRCALDDIEQRVDEIFQDIVYKADLDAIYNDRNKI